MKIYLYATIYLKSLYYEKLQICDTIINQYLNYMVPHFNYGFALKLLNNTVFKLLKLLTFNILEVIIFAKFKSRFTHP